MTSHISVIILCKIVLFPESCHKDSFTECKQSHKFKIFFTIVLAISLIIIFLISTSSSCMLAITLIFSFT